MDGYSFQDSLDGDSRRRGVSVSFAPGERVTVAARRASWPEARRLLAASNDGILTVKAVHVGAREILYEFQEAEGWHRSEFFEDPRPVANVTGAISLVDGQAWLVEIEPVTDDGEFGFGRPTGRCAPLSGVTGRYLAWKNGIASDEDLMAYAEKGRYGVFVVFRSSGRTTGRGNWRPSCWR